jgi:hypothetical protein
VPRNAVKGPLRAVMLTVPAGFVLLIGGFAAVALGERALGVALLVLALLTLGAACILAYRFKNQADSFARAAQQQRQADLERTFRAGDNGPGRLTRLAGAAGGHSDPYIALLMLP